MEPLWGLFSSDSFPINLHSINSLPMPFSLVLRLLVAYLLFSILSSSLSQSSLQRQKEEIIATWVLCGFCHWWDVTSHHKVPTYPYANPIEPSSSLYLICPNCVCVSNDKSPLHEQILRYFILLLIEGGGGVILLFLRDQKTPNNNNYNSLLTTVQHPSTCLELIAIFVYDGHDYQWSCHQMRGCQGSGQQCDYYAFLSDWPLSGPLSFSTPGFV